MDVAAVEDEKDGCARRLAALLADGRCLALATDGSEWEWHNRRIRMMAVAMSMSQLVIVITN